MFKIAFLKIYDFLKKEFCEKWLFYFTFLFSILTIFLFMKGELMCPDGVGYYVYIQSLILDRDFSFLNNLESLGVSHQFGWFSPIHNNYISNPFAMGTGVAWIPFFLLAHLITLIANILVVKAGFTFHTDGTSYIYVAILSLGSCFYGLLALFLSFKVAKRFFSSEDSFLAMLAIWTTSPFVFNFYWMPTHSHLIDSFAIALFLFLWIGSKDKDGLFWWFCYGLAFGFATLVRWQNLLFGILLLIPPRKLVIPYILFLFGAFLTFLPQLVVWKIIYGKFILIPQGKEFMQWTNPEILKFLFSSWHGLYSWTPIIFFSTLGLFWFYKKNKRISACFLIAFLLQVYVNSCVSDWWAGTSFGARRITGLTFVFLLGLASFFSFLGKRRLLKYLILAFCVFWTETLIISMLSSPDLLTEYRSYSDLIKIQINTFFNLKSFLPMLVKYGPLIMLNRYHQINTFAFFAIKIIYFFMGIVFFLILRISYGIIIKSKQS